MKPKSTEGKGVKQRYTFASYYKYYFIVVGEDGVTYYLDDDYCNSDDIYRFDIRANGEMEFVDGIWTIDGLPFRNYD